MHQHYADILSRIKADPIWFDEYGVPRYCEFSPDEVANIYVDEAALVQIACQGCGHLFKVAFSRDRLGRHDAKGAWLCDEIKANCLSYGDPPNVDCCPAGPTMTSDAVRVLEYWRRLDHQWVRDASLEVFVYT